MKIVARPEVKTRKHSKKSLSAHLLAGAILFMRGSIGQEITWIALLDVFGAELFDARIQHSD